MSVETVSLLTCLEVHQCSKSMKLSSCFRETMYWEILGKPHVVLGHTQETVWAAAQPFSILPGRTRKSPHPAMQDTGDAEQLCPLPSVNSSSRKPCIIQQGLGGSVRPRERRSASCVGQGGKSRLWLLGFLPGEISVFRIPQDAWATSTKARGGKGENYTLLWLKIGLKFRYRIYFLLLNYPRMLRLTDTSWKF